MEGKISGNILLVSVNCCFLNKTARKETNQSLHTSLTKSRKKSIKFNSIQYRIQFLLFLPALIIMATSFERFYCFNRFNKFQFSLLATYFIIVQQICLLFYTTSLPHVIFYLSNTVKL